MELKLCVNSKITGLCQGNKTYFSQALNQTLQTTEMNSNDLPIPLGTELETVATEISATSTK